MNELFSGIEVYAMALAFFNSWIKGTQGGSCQGILWKYSYFIFRMIVYGHSITQEPSDRLEETNCRFRESFGCPLHNTGPYFWLMNLGP